MYLLVIGQKETGEKATGKQLQLKTVFVRITGNRTKGKSSNIFIPISRFNIINTFQ